MFAQILYIRPASLLSDLEDLEDVHDDFWSSDKMPPVFSGSHN